MPRSLLTIAIVLIGCPTMVRGDDAAARRFDMTVAPILIQRCLECHSGADPKGKLDLSTSRSTLAGGENGSALVVGRPQESLLWERVDDDEMPPENPLSSAEKSILQEWIQSGAEWGTDPVDSFRFTTNRRAGYNWWALQPVVDPRSEEHTSELQSRRNLVCRLLLEKKNKKHKKDLEKQTQNSSCTCD